MFRIGEFAQIGQVSSRLLRFYDQLGLLQPVHIDRNTGFRYYNALIAFVAATAQAQAEATREAQRAGIAAAQAKTEERKRCGMDAE